jgi:hypothetical protein
MKRVPVDDQDVVPAPERLIGGLQIITLHRRTIEESQPNQPSKTSGKSLANKIILARFHVTE